MIWKILKLLSVVISIIGIAWFAGGQHGFVMGFLLLLIGVVLFIVCRIFEPTIVKIKESKE